MVAQAFLFNAVFFTYGLVLTHFHHVGQTRVGLYLLPLTLGNFAGPLLLGSLFDTIEWRYGVNAEQKSLESIAAPLSSQG
jgi:hypothetical protein